MSSKTAVQRNRSGDLGGQAAWHCHPIQRFWKCCLRNPVTCLPKWGGAQYYCSHSSRMIFWVTSAIKTGNSSSRKRKQLSDVKCSSSINGPVTWLPITPRQNLIEQRLWKCVIVNSKLFHQQLLNARIFIKIDVRTYDFWTFPAPVEPQNTSLGYGHRIAGQSIRKLRMLYIKSFIPVSSVSLSLVRLICDHKVFYSV
jgi:hypothetical protein